jgi:hypothetical protein
MYLVTQSALPLAAIFLCEGFHSPLSEVASKGERAGSEASSAPATATFLRAANLLFELGAKALVLVDHSMEGSAKLSALSPMTCSTPYSWEKTAARSRSTPRLGGAAEPGTA